MIEAALDYLFSNNPVTMAPMWPGVFNIAGVRTPRNERHHEDLSRGAALTVLQSLHGLARCGERPAD